MSEQAGKYRQIVRFVNETPWAIIPSALYAIEELVTLAAAGVKLEPAEIAQRIGPKKADPAQPGGAVAVLPLWGVLVPHGGLMSEISGATALDSWVAQFRELVADPQIGTIILDVDSPGGSVELLTETATEIRAARNKKQIVAVANTMAGSAAFQLATQASEFFVTPSGMVGSVGTIASHQDISQQLEADGVKVTHITAGEFKAEQAPTAPLSNEARAEIQRKVDYFYAQFVGDVAKGRGVDQTTVTETYGKGRMLQAQPALRAGMVDGIATLDQVIARALGTKLSSRTRTTALEEPVEIAAGVFVTTTLAEAITSGSMNFTGAAGIAGHRFGAVLDDEHESTTEAAAIGAPADNDNTKEAPKMRAMTPEERAARLAEIKARQEELNTTAVGRAFDDDEQTEFDALKEERIKLLNDEQNIAAREQELRDAYADPDKQVSGDGAAPILSKGVPGTNAGKRIPDNVHDISAYRGLARSFDDLNGLYADGARRVNEHLAFEMESPDKARAHVERLLKKDPKSEFALRVLGTADPAYDKAFGRAVMFGLDSLSQRERETIQAAVSNTGLGNETPVPVTIDPSVMLTSDGQVNPLRQISRTVTITGNKWRGITSEGVTVEYQAELTQVADQTPDFDSPEAEVAKAQGWVEFSIEVDQDWGAFRSELASMFQDAKDAKEAEKFLFGSGTNEPEGLIWKLTDDDSSVVDTATTNVFDVADLYSLRSALPPRFRSGASWLGNDDLYSAVRQFDESGGSALWAQLAADRPPTLIGKPAYEASEISGLTTNGGEDVLVYGDFGRGFVIVDRVGLNVELVPLVMGANNRPKGSRGLYVYFRNTSQVRTVNAFRLLRIKQT